MTEHEPLDPHERRRISDALDRVEERLYAAHFGLHIVNEPADPQALAASGLPESAQMVWARWDGLELGQGEGRLLPLAEIDAATAAARDEGLLREGDRVIGERGRDLYVLPADPWSEGAEVVLLEEEGDRSPDASSVAHLVLGILGECGVLFDEQGEFRDDLFDEYGTFEPKVIRRLLRRRLDMDEDAPRARLLLAADLRKQGEFKAARSELNELVKRAPEWSAVHHELGRVLEGSGDRAGALRAYVKAAEHADGDAGRAEALAHAAAVADDERRTELAANVLALRPDFVAHQALGARALLEQADLDAARELVRLGLAVIPQHLELLDLRRQLNAVAD